MSCDVMSLCQYRISPHVTRSTQYTVVNKMLQFLLFIRQTGHVDRWIEALCSQPARSSFGYQTCQHDILKMNEPILTQIATSGPQGRARNDQLWDQWVKGQGHTSPKMDLKGWRNRHSHYSPFGSSSLSSFDSNFPSNRFLNQYSISRLDNEPGQFASLIASGILHITSVKPTPKAFST